MLESGKDLAEVFGPKRGVGGIVHVTACIDDLKGGAVKRVTVDPDAFSVTAGMPIFSCAVGFFSSGAIS